jgi:oligosaccharide repeat unit polymerase
LRGGATLLYLLFVATTLFFFFMGLLRTGKKFNPLSFYIFFWGIWLTVSLTNPYKMNTVSNEAYLLIWVNITFFALGFIVVSKRGKMIKLEELGGREILQTKTFLFLQIFVFIVLFLIYQKYKMLLLSLTAEEARNTVYGVGLLFNTTYEYYFFIWVITPLVFSSVVMLITNLTINGLKSLAFYVSLVNCFLFGLIGYGRLVYFQVIAFFLISLGFRYDLQKNINSKLKKIKIKTKIFFIAISVVAVYVMNYSTLKRLGINSPSLEDHINIFIDDSWKQFILYFTGPFRAFDNFLKSDIAENIGYTLGRSTFGGIEEIVNALFSFIGLGWPSANSLTATFTVPPTVIGPGITFNAFYTNVMNFYLDGGLAFVMMFSLAYGVISGMVYNNYLKKPNIFTLSIVVYLTYHMMASEFRWSFSSPTVWITILCLVWANRKYIRKGRLQRMTQIKDTEVA